MLGFGPSSRRDASTIAQCFSFGYRMGGGRQVPKGRPTPLQTCDQLACNALTLFAHCYCPAITIMLTCFACRSLVGGLGKKLPRPLAFSMKILVRQAGTELHLSSNGEWGARVSAREFPNLEVAGQEALRFEDAEVVLSYDQPPCELSLNPAYCAKQARPRPPL